MPEAVARAGHATCTNRHLCLNHFRLGLLSLISDGRPALAEDSRARRGRVDLLAQPRPKLTCLSVNKLSSGLGQAEPGLLSLTTGKILLVLLCHGR